jgi:hypothetical protein
MSRESPHLAQGPVPQMMSDRPTTEEFKVKKKGSPYQASSSRKPRKAAFLPASRLLQQSFGNLHNWRSTCL